ncbi:MAG: tRNA pseudouridine(38-40) synthase TruA [Ignavibacteriaceae bacterium]|nr:tRNA pseudouridine(38-40) synthase TruA [Ignavibacteriaceae bacterium]
MKNYKLTIQYDGTDYSGWQYQLNAPSIQKEIQDAIKTILKEEIKIIGSGRTDAGVHALGQVANFLTDAKIDTFKFKHSLNALLPNDIAVLEMEEVSDTFNSRFDAIKRSYIYLITNHKSPFYQRYSFQYYKELNCKKLNQLSNSFIGEKDFSSFCRTKTETDNKVCIVYDAHWRTSGGMTVFFIEGNRFLHGMVRSIVGTLLNALKNDFENDYINEIFALKNREEADEAVPAKGLFLFKVKY